jgi:hypothetical protein
MSAEDKTREVPRCQVDYLHGASRRRLKSGPASFAGGAGLTPEARYSGRNTPLKGKGAPPPDNKDGSYARSCIRTMPATHNMNSINVVRPDASAPTKVRRAAVKVLDASYASSVKGAAAIVAAEVRREPRGPGLGAIRGKGGVCEGGEGSGGASRGSAAHAARPARSPPGTPRPRDPARRASPRCRPPPPQPPVARAVRRVGLEAPADDIDSTKRVINGARARLPGAGVPCAPPAAAPPYARRTCPA